MVNGHMIVEGALALHLLVADRAGVFEHPRVVDRFAVVPHRHSADESFSTDGASPLILATVRSRVLHDKLEKLVRISETQTRP